MLPRRTLRRLIAVLCPIFGGRRISRLPTKDLRASVCIVFGIVLQKLCPLLISEQSPA
eukprot:COSAG01_NODE_2336_length_7874_cov_42.809928_4_plen_58_part_00